MVSCILASLLISLLSMLTSGLPTIVFLILLSSSGLMDYILAFTFAIISILELIKLIFTMKLEGDISFSIRDILGTIKSFIKNLKNKNKKKDENKRVKNEIEFSNKLKVFEIALIIVFAILSIFIKPHSCVLNLIYDNLFIRMLCFICIPLMICDLINNFKAGLIDGLGDFIATVFTMIAVPGIIAIILSTSFIATSKMFYEDILENDIKPLFIYDNQEYDELRKNEEFIDEITYLKNTFINKVTDLKNKYDINDKNAYQNLKNTLLREIDIRCYGYEITDKEWENDDTVLLCIVDKKTRNHNIYKLNLRDNTFVLSSTEEFENIRSTNYENKKNK